MKNLAILGIIIGIIVIGIFSQLAFSQMLVPDWVRNTAKWYGEGLISEGEFVNAIKFLIENKIILLEEKTSEISKPTTEIPQLDQTQVVVTKPRLNYCIVVYPTFQDLGDFRFKTKYSHVNYINECIKLYKDPVWQYQGDDRIDVLYKRFLILLEEAKENKIKLSSDPEIKILYTTSLGKENFLIKFNVCAGNSILDKAKILIKSEIEAIQVGSSKDIPANTCRSYETQINAKYVENIQVSIIEQVLK